jgi:4'-phosphopantetheinyl transferase
MTSSIPQQVHIWRLRLDSPQSVDAAVLSRAERARADAFTFPDLRRRYIAAHTALRYILGPYVGLPANRLVFSTTEFGKPGIVAATDVRFNLSHSEQHAVIAVAGVDVGVDIERVRPLADMQGLFEASFAPGEISALHAIPSADRPLAFFRCWVRKEAYIKARGLGLRLALNTFEVSVEHSPKTILLRGDVEGWSVHDLQTDAATYPAALSIQGERLAIRYCDWPIAQRG